MPSQTSRNRKVPSSTKAYKRNAAAFRKQRRYSSVSLRAKSSGKTFRVRG